MPQADNVVSFPVGPGTTEFLHEYIGGAQQRLDNIVARLGGLEAILFLLKNVDELPPMVANAFGGIEDAVHDCMAIAELRPMGAPL